MTFASSVMARLGISATQDRRLWAAAVSPAEISSSTSVEMRIFKSVPSIFPPLVSFRLAPGNDDIATRPCREVTDD